MRKGFGELTSALAKMKEQLKERDAEVTELRIKVMCMVCGICATCIGVGICGVRWGEGGMGASAPPPTNFQNKVHILQGACF